MYIFHIIVFPKALKKNICSNASLTDYGKINNFICVIEYDIS